MIDLECRDFDEAWLKINRKFLGAEGDRPEDACRALMCYSFDNVISLYGRPQCTLDPGILVNYSKQKWSHLLRSYMDWNQWEWLKARVKFRMARKDDMVIPLAYAFKAKPQMNGSCVLGYTFLIDRTNSKIQISVHTRVAEVTRRMMMDYILFYKMWQELFPEEIWDNYDWTIQMYYQMMYQSAMFVPVLHNVLDFKEMGISSTGKTHSGFLGRVEREIQVCMTTTSKGSGFAQMAKIRDLVAADLQGKPRKSLPISKFILEPMGMQLKAINEAKAEINRKMVKKGCYN
jgi:hypothetical protein